MKKQYEMVKKFHKKFNYPIANSSTMLSPHRVVKRMEWIYEGLLKLLDAKTVTNQVNALADILYFTLGSLVEIGTDNIDEIFAEVHKSKMTKLCNETDNGSNQIMKN